MIDAIKAAMGKLFTPTTWYGVVGLLGCSLLYYLFQVMPERAAAQGQIVGQAECISAAASSAVTNTVAAAASAASQANADMTRANKAGTQHERARVRIDTTFKALDEEARHDQSNPVDACVLPAERLRRWASANAGPVSAADTAHQGTAATQHDTTAPGPAATNIGRDARSGEQPPTGGQGLPPTGSAALQPAQVPGD